MLLFNKWVAVALIILDYPLLQATGCLLQVQGRSPLRSTNKTDAVQTKLTAIQGDRNGVAEFFSTLVRVLVTVGCSCPYYPRRGAALL